MLEACPWVTCTCLYCALFGEQDNVLSGCASFVFVNGGDWVFCDTLHSVIPQVISVVIRAGITSICNSSVRDGYTVKGRSRRRRTHTQACQYLRYDNLYLTALIVKTI